MSSNHKHSQSCSHSHAHDHHHSSNNEKVVRLSFFITFGFMVVEVIGGFMANSLALIADAGHMLTDASALALSWAGFYFGRKQINHQKTFGYARFEVLAALLNAIALFAITIWIAAEAYQRFQNPEMVMALPMFIIALIGLFVNCLVFYILTRGDKEHLNIKSAALHVLGDLLGSVGAVGAAIVIYFTGWMPIDPILSIFVCLLILRGAWQILTNALHILMEGTPKGIDIEKIKKSLEKLENITEVTHIHIWEITSGKPMATLNISVCGEKNIIKAISSVKKELAEKFQIEHSTVEVGSEACSLKKRAR